MGSFIVKLLGFVGNEIFENVQCRWRKALDQSNFEITF